MAINEWWAGDPTQRYWLEITDRSDLGDNLRAPQLTDGGQETASYSLVRYVQEGDVVFHWWKGPGAEPAIIGFSTCTGEPFESRIKWQAHGTYGRAAGKATWRASWETPISGLTYLDEPVTLARLRQKESAIRRVRERLTEEHLGALYFPYALSDKRPIRTSQGYLLKFPVELLEALPELRQGRQTPLPPAEPSPMRPSARRRGTSGPGRQQDPLVRRAVEKHAVRLAMRHLENAGYLTDDVGDTESFDILAINGDDDELHVEVKGSTSESIAVELTDGEVKHWGSDYRRMLIVVDRITCRNEADGLVTGGGRVRVWDDWELDDSSLVPTRYRYTLPGGATEPPSR